MNAHFENYNLLTDLSGSDGDLKVIIDTVNAKYNNSFWKVLTDVMPARRSKKFATIIEETGIIVKASVVGSESRKPIRSFEGGAEYEDSMPKIGHAFNFSQADINKIEELNYVNQDMAKMAAAKYLNRTQKLIAGFHATWNGWIYQAMSDQIIRLDSFGDTPSTVDLRTKASHKLVAKGTAGWFASGTTAKIADDLQRMNKIADEDNLPANRAYVCSKQLFDKIVADPAIKAAILATMPLATSDSYLSPKMISKMISTVFDIPAIFSIDEVSRIEVDGIPVLNTADFNVNKISLIPVGKLFDMHNSPSDYSKDTNPAVYKAVTEGGLIGSLQQFSSNPINILTSYESWTFPTFKNPDFIVSLDSSTGTTTGLPE